ncbi:MAG: universal stress protein [Desulfobacterales bacterium]|nr:universal stress protein [Desulfobacterales bacterium]
MELVIKKILYATDLSKNSAYAFQYAMDYSEKHDAQIVILHVYEKLRWADMTELEDNLQIAGQMKAGLKNKENTAKNIRERLGKFCEKIRKDDPSCTFNVDKIEVCEGYPANTILEKADEFDCDLIVMGTHGKGRIAHAFLGSVAEKVLQRSRRPVFIIPLPEEDTELSYLN